MMNAAERSRKMRASKLSMKLVKLKVVVLIDMMEVETRMGGIKDCVRVPEIESESLE